MGTSGEIGSFPPSVPTEGTEECHSTNMVVVAPLSSVVMFPSDVALGRILVQCAVSEGNTIPELERVA